MLAYSAFLTLSTLTPQESILPNNIKSVSDQSVVSTEIVWEALCSSPIPTSNKQHTRRPATNWLQQTTHPCSRQDHNTMWTRPASSTYSGQRLTACAPIASIGLRLSDEAVRLAVAQRLGCKACEPRTCTCGKPVDARGPAVKAR